MDLLIKNSFLIRVQVWLRLVTCPLMGRDNRKWYRKSFIRAVAGISGESHDTASKTGVFTNSRSIMCWTPPYLQPPSVFRSFPGTFSSLFNCCDSSSLLSLSFQLQQTSVSRDEPAAHCLLSARRHAGGFLLIHIVTNGFLSQNWFWSQRWTEECFPPADTDNWGNVPLKVFFWWLINSIKFAPMLSFCRRISWNRQRSNWINNWRNNMQKLCVHLNIIIYINANQLLFLTILFEGTSTLKTGTCSVFTD